MISVIIRPPATMLDLKETPDVTVTICITLVFILYNMNMLQYFRSGQIMMVLVLAFMVQWWSWVVHAIWAYFSTPQIWLIFVVVLFCNIGGLLNAFAYTIIRRNYLKKDRRILKRKGTTVSSSKETESTQI